MLATKLKAAAEEQRQSDLPRLVALVQERLLHTVPAPAANPWLDQGARAELLTFIRGVLAEVGVAERFLASSAQAVLDEVAGFGPLEPLLRDPEICEIMVNGHEQVVVEWRGKLISTGVRFQSETHLTEIIGRILAPLGRRLDHASPYVDARLPDGSRLHAILPPLSLKGPLVTIRKFRRQRLRLSDLVAGGSLTPAMADFLHLCLRARCNLLICGPVSSGKTTLLNALLGLVDENERVVTVEDSAELLTVGPLAVGLEARPASAEGQGEVTLRQLLRNALRMRPDRLVVGEVRGGEAFDLLLAMNTGHPALATIHGSSALDALNRLQSMVLMAGEGLPLTAIREQLGRSVDVIIHCGRSDDGQRRVTEICAVVSSTRGPRLSPLFDVAGEPLGRAPEGFLQRLRRAGYAPFAWLEGA